MTGKKEFGDSGFNVAPFIVFEGIDGVGKTPQLKQLHRWMEEQYGFPIHLTGEPTDRPIGKLLKRALKRQVKLDGICQALLFAADRIDHFKTEITANIQRGIPVLCDRYYMSSFAYQWREMPDDLEWIESINARARHPDLTLLIDAPAEVCMERIRLSRTDTELYEELETLRSIRANYLELAQRRQPMERIEVIDGMRSSEEVHKDVCAQVKEVMSPYCNG